uniref:Uncharacterized protein n=1 Tax=Neogobius melanostomus TaxID=47308 RepID=A0A8C6UFM6_9GOBI
MRIKCIYYTVWHICIHKLSELMRASWLPLTAVLALSAAVARAEMIDDVLSSLARGADFLEGQHEHINLDGVVGYLMLQAEGRGADLASLGPVSWAQRSSVVGLVRRLDQSLERAVSALRQSEPNYYREFEPLLTWRFWSVPGSWVTTDSSLVYSSTLSAECYDEQLSDKCLTLLLGTWKQNGTPCIVTKPCRDMMTRFGCPFYSLSHQLLYFMIGAMKGCSNLLKGDTRASRVNMTEDGLSALNADIFMENILVCGLAGFSDFYKVDWLQHIFRLQDVEVGCFGRDSTRIGEELLEQLQPHHRVKRREKVLHDGCSSHMTGVAVGALGGFLNYYLQEQDITKRPLS